MDRLIAVMLAVLVLAVTGLGVVVWRAADQAHEDQTQLICLQQAETTATIAMLAPESNVDEAGRLRAMEALGDRLDACVE